MPCVVTLTRTLDQSDCPPRILEMKVLQNSIVSLTKAAEAKVYGSEFDVQLTKDKEIVVNHDDSIQNLHFDTPFAELKGFEIE